MRHRALIAIFFLWAVLVPCSISASVVIDHSATASLSSGLVGYWPLDGETTVWTSASAGTTKDISGNESTGTLVGMSTITSPIVGKIGGALKFNGANSGVQLNSQFIGTGPLTVSMWVKAVSSGQNNLGRFFDNGTTILNFTSSPFPFLQFQAGGSSFITPSSVPLGVWVKVDVTCTATGNAVIYLNGAFFASGLVGAMTNGTSNLTFGNRVSGARALNGAIDDIRIYNRVLSAQEVKQLYAAGSVVVARSNTTTLASGLVGYWPLDGNTTNWKTGITSDLSGNGQNGNLISMSTTTSPVVGKIGGAFNFNGANNIKISTSAYQFSNTKFTVSAWVKGSAAAVATNYFVDESDGGVGTGWTMGAGGNCTSQQLFVFIKHVSSQNTFACSTKTVIDSKWHHVVAILTTDTVVAGNDNIVLYVDGALSQGSLTIDNSTYSAATGVLTIAKRPATGVFYTGTIDDVRYRLKKLSSSTNKVR